MLVLKNCRLIPELTEGYTEEYADIAIDGELIKGIYPVGQAPDGESMDMHNATVLPGFLDLHAHLNFDTMTVEKIVARSPEQCIVAGISYGQSMLRSGYTFIRDCGLAHYAGKYFRQLFDGGLAMGPHILFSGACNTPTVPGNKQLGPIYREFDGAENALSVVREDVANGADFVKYMVTGAMMNEGGDPQAMICTEEELNAVVSAAKSCGTYVACHCHGKPGILACIKAGVYTVEHSTFLDEECIDAYIKAEGKTVIIPTVGVLRGIIMDDSVEVAQYMKDRVQNIYEHVCKYMGMAYRAGVAMGFGSDLYRPMFEKCPGLEFTSRKGFGLSNTEILRQATIDSARIIGYDDRCGTIKAGKWADLVAIDGNPDEDIRVMTKLPVHVFKQGKQFV